jgi:hypothetical protein
MATKNAIAPRGTKRLSSCMQATVVKRRRTPL